MKKIICLLAMFFSIISNIYCVEEDAVASLIEAIETERKLVLQENDYEIIDVEEKGSKRGWEGVLIKILNEDIYKRLKSIGLGEDRYDIIELGIIYINGEAKFVNDIIFNYKEDTLEQLSNDDYDILIDAIKIEYIVILQENDYSIFNSNDRYLTIVILNENIMKKIKEAFIPPPIFIYIDGSVKFIKEMGIYESGLPYPPRDYIYWTDRDRKIMFDYGILLRLATNERFSASGGRQQQTIFLREIDYEIIRERNGRLTSKILNNDKLKEIREAVNPEIVFRIDNNRRIIAHGKKTSGLDVLYPCDYTFKINANNKVIFSNLKRDTLVLTPIEEHIIKYIKTLNIQYILNNSYEEQYNVVLPNTLSPDFNGIFKGISGMEDKEQMNTKKIVLIILLAIIGGFIIYKGVRAAVMLIKTREIR